MNITKFWKSAFKALWTPVSIIVAILFTSLVGRNLYFGQPIVESPILVGSIFIGLWAVGFVYYFYFKKPSGENIEQNNE